MNRSDREGRHLACRLPLASSMRPQMEAWFHKDGYDGAVISGIDASQSKTLDVEFRPNQEINMKPNRLRISGIAVVALLAASCTGAIDDVGIDGTGISAGRDITSMGRVRSLGGGLGVNGVRYDMSGATVTIDGSASTATDINEGDVVMVRGVFDQATGKSAARQIVADHILQGRIDTIDTAGHSFAALGQKVQINDHTTFGSSVASGLNGLSAGDSVNVSGFRTFFGSIIATRIDRQVAGSVAFKTTGAITDVAADGKHFSINGLVVDYGSAIGIAATGSAALKRGTFVEVKGPEPASGLLVASSVGIRSNQLMATTNSLVHIEGYVTARSATDASQLEINGLAVSTSNATLISGTLSNDAPVLVTGQISASGQIAASGVSVTTGNPTDIPAPPSPPPSPTPTEAIQLVNVQGRVFNALSGTIAKGPDPTFEVQVWVQTARLNTTYQPTWKPDGTFTVSVPKDALVLTSAFKEGYVQPCAVMEHAREGLTFDVELIAETSFDSTNPPLPVAATGAKTTVTGSIYEMVDGARQPVAGVEVWLGYLDDVMSGINHARTLTDRNGHYFACSMPSDPEWWGITEIGVYKEGYEYQTVWHFDTSKSQVFDLELKRR